MDPNSLQPNSFQCYKCPAEFLSAKDLNDHYELDHAFDSEAVNGGGVYVEKKVDAENKCDGQVSGDKKGLVYGGFEEMEIDGGEMKSVEKKKLLTQDDLNDFNSPAPTCDFSLFKKKIFDEKKGVWKSPLLTQDDLNDFNSPSDFSVDAENKCVKIQGPVVKINLEDDIDIPPVLPCHDVSIIHPQTQHTVVLNPNDFELGIVEEKENKFQLIKDN